MKATGQKSPEPRCRGWEAAASGDGTGWEVPAPQGQAQHSLRRRKARKHHSAQTHTWGVGHWQSISICLRCPTAPQAPTEGGKAILASSAPIHRVQKRQFLPPLFFIQSPALVQEKDALKFHQRAQPSYCSQSSWVAAKVWGHRVPRLPTSTAHSEQMA